MGERRLKKKISYSKPTPWYYKRLLMGIEKRDISGIKRLQGGEKRLKNETLVKRKEKRLC